MHSLSSNQFRQYNVGYKGSSMKYALRVPLWRGFEETVRLRLRARVYQKHKHIFLQGKI